MEKHLPALSRLYHLVPLSDYVSFLRRESENPLPKKALIVTLDDGYAQNYTLRDLFLQYDVRPTIFVCTSLIGTNRGFWFRHVENPEELKKLPHHERTASLATSGFDAEGDLERREVLSDAELRELSSIAEIQSHTVTHPILTTCTLHHVTAELLESKLDLEDRLGYSVYALAYPNGDYSRRVISLVARAGYKCALTVGGRVNSKRTPVFEIQRIAIDDDDGVDELIVKASGMWAWTRCLRGRPARRQSW
jgi:peptidoglycan/xylan/chitin deacetylase (PgdA/CDA1 family)